MSYENLSEAQREEKAFNDIQKMHLDGGATHSFVASQNPELAKSFVQPSTPTSGITRYELEVPAKILFPVTTPIRNTIPRKRSPFGSTAVNWEAFTSLNPGNLLGVNAEGVRGTILTDSSVRKTAYYKQMGLENYATFEANFASRNFGGQDALSYMTSRTLYATMEVEEKMILGGNTTVALGTTPTPTLTDLTTGGNLLASTTYRVICVALTYEGNIVSNLTTGVVGQVTQTNADASTTVYGGGSAAISTAATITTSGASAHTIQATVSVVNGAVAYAWYLGTTAGTERLIQITNTNSAALTDISTTSQLASAITNGSSDNSINLTRYDGILYTIFDPASGAVVYDMPTGTPGQGSALTADGVGGIEEIESVLEDMWNTYRMAPTTIYVGGREMRDIRAKVLGGGGAPLFRFNADADKPSDIVAGSVIGSYLNMYTLGGGQLMKVILHPFIPAGTILFTCDNVQKSYPQSNVGNPLEIECRQDYYQMMWPPKTKKFEYGVYLDSVLKNYFAPAFAVIRNIGTG